MQTISIQTNLFAAGTAARTLVGSGKLRLAFYDIHNCSVELR